MRMPFSERIERAHNLSREQARLRGAGMRDDLSPSDMMEKGDGLAMLIAALITIVPACLVVLALLAGVGYWFVMH